MIVLVTLKERLWNIWMQNLVNYNHLIARLHNSNHQAILFCGTDLATQESISYKLISNLLCDKHDSFLCGSCNGCILLLANNHPDLFVVNIQDNKGKIASIAIEDVKGIQSFLALTTHYNNKKIVFIKNINLCSYSAMNALLKILEEPPNYALFVILSENVGLVLPTIRSRCVEFKLPYNTNYEFMANNIDKNRFSVLIDCLLCPSIDNIYKLSNEIGAKDNSFIIFMNLIVNFITDLSYFIVTKKIMQNSIFKKHLIDIESINSIALNKLFCLFDDLVFLINTSGQNINHKLHFENFLFKYQNIFR